jgi:hypothetical protein
LKIIKYSVGFLLFALFLAAIVTPAAAWTTEEWVGGSDGFMINNVIIEAGSIGISSDDDKNTTTGNVSLTIYEWKNNKWERINGTKLSLDQSMSFKAADGNYTVKVLDLREIGRYNEAKLEIWTNADVAGKGTVIEGGHSKAEGAGQPNLIITKVITPSGGISVDDTVTVSIHIENKGNYDARNVNIDDPQPVGVLVTGVTINNTRNQTISKNSNQVVYSYQAKVMQPGSLTFQPATVTAENTLGQEFKYQSNSTTVQVNDLAALVFSSPPPSGNTVDYHIKSKIDGSITIRNIGTMPAQYVGIEFNVPTNAIIDGKDITVNGNKATIYIDQVMPNNERIINYTLTAAASGYYEVNPITYSYTYNNSNKTGSLESVSFNAVGNNTIETAANYWYALLIPLILIGVVAFFFWKRHREYKF